MTEPTTAAGRALVAILRMESWTAEGPYGPAAYILAIEAEARQQDGSALRPDVQQWLTYMRELRDDDHLTEYGRGALDAYENVERALAALPPSAPPALDVDEVLRLLRLIERDYDDGLTEPESEDMIRDVRVLLARLQEPER